MEKIEKAAVLGAGVMGATIAAHLVNAGLDVVLLDLEIEKDGRPTKLADLAVESMRKAKPSPLFLPEWRKKIRTGSFNNDLELLRDRDWVIEVVKEDLKIKHSLFEKVLPFLSKDALLTTNTSGIPIGELSAGLPEEVAVRFFGTHFFNPPRYMKLLECIPGPNTDENIFAKFLHFGETVLGKGVVVAKDRPNFIANRIGVLAMMSVMGVMIEDGYSIEEVDKIMGPLTGRPRSAVFRTADLVGLDTFVHVSENLYEAVPEDELRARFVIPESVKGMVAKGLLGDKTGKGFYRKSKDKTGQKVIETIDLDTLEYRGKAKPNLPTLDLYKNVEDTGQRLAKMAFSKDRVGQFVWKTFSEVLVYSANRFGEIADDIVNIDRALRWGFNWELGPFETWDALGVEAVAEKLKAEGREVPKLVQDLLGSGQKSFYGEGVAPTYFDGAKPQALPARPNVTLLKQYKKDAKRIVKQLPGASLVDLGDGIALLEFHSKMNAIGSDTISMTQFAVDTVEKDFAGLVVGNQGGNFSAGANLMLLLMEAQEGNFEDIDLMTRSFQKATTSLRYCAKPVVVAPYGLTLGGGCEFTLHGDGVQAAAETYMGLVEMGVGLIPAGGGTKEMLLRHVGAAAKRGENDLIPALRSVFETIGMAKVSTSGEEARTLGFLKDTDGITMNGDALIEDAKRKVMGLAAGGYQAPKPPQDIPVAGAPGFAALKLGLYMMREGGYISEHDQKIGTHLARILTGGNLTPGQTMTEQHVLDLEREAFLSLCGERKTLERIHYMLTNNKPLRN